MLHIMRRAYAYIVHQKFSVCSPWTNERTKERDKIVVERKAERIVCIECGIAVSERQLHLSVVNARRPFNIHSNLVGLHGSSSVNWMDGHGHACVRACIHIQRKWNDLITDHTYFALISNAKTNEISHFCYYANLDTDRASNHNTDTGIVLFLRVHNALTRVCVVGRK